MPTISPTFRPPGNAHNLLAQTGVGRVTQDYRNNRNVFAQGEVAGSVLFIQTGRVKLTVMSNYGKEAIIGIMEAGQFFGEGCLQNQPLRGATAITLSDCRITSITKDAMLSAIRDQPQFSKLFMDHLLSRNSRIEEDVVDQLFNSSEKRLARLLCFSQTMGRKAAQPSFRSFSIRRHLRK
jgi:CRP/FNR family transcriptional regulator, cyclic AMP receptor protein